MDIAIRRLVLSAIGAVALVILAGVIIALASPDPSGSMATTPSRATASSPPTSTKPTVVLEFNGAASGVDITMSENGKISQIADRAVPVHVEVPLASGTEIYWSGQSQSEDGDISCRILVDGVVVDENRSVGGYVITTCQATVP